MRGLADADGASGAAFDEQLEQALTNVPRKSVFREFLVDQTFRPGKVEDRSMATGTLAIDGLRIALIFPPAFRSVRAMPRDGRRAS